MLEQQSWEEQLKDFYYGLDGDYNEKRADLLVEFIRNNVLHSTRLSVLQEVEQAIDIQKNKVFYSPDNEDGKIMIYSKSATIQLLDELRAKLEEMKK